MSDDTKSITESVYINMETTPSSPPPEGSAGLGTNGIDAPRRPSLVAEATAGDVTTQQTAELEDYRLNDSIQQPPVVVTTPQCRFFNQIITKRVPQPLMIETVQEIFSDVQCAVQALVMCIFERKMGTKPVKLMEASDRRRGSAVGSLEVGRTPRMR